MRIPKFAAAGGAILITALISASPASAQANPPASGTTTAASGDPTMGIPVGDGMLKHAIDAGQGRPDAITKAVGPDDFEPPSKDPPSKDPPSKDPPEKDPPAKEPPERDPPGVDPR